MGKFEDNMNKLENIVKELEEGELSLEQSVDGIKLSKICNEILEDAEKKITMLVQEDEDIKEVEFES